MLESFKFQNKITTEVDVLRYCTYKFIDLSASEIVEGIDTLQAGRRLSLKRSRTALQVKMKMT